MEYNNKSDSDRNSSPEWEGPRESDREQEWEVTSQCLGHKVRGKGSKKRQQEA